LRVSEKQEIEIKKNEKSMKSSNESVSVSDNEDESKE